MNVDLQSEVTALKRMLEVRNARIEVLQAALWPFAMKGLHDTTVCADDFRRAKEAMPHAPDHGGR